MQQQYSKEESPQTGHSTNMKTRARKSLEPVVYDVDQPIREQIMKNVKKEKLIVY